MIVSLTLDFIHFAFIGQRENLKTKQNKTTPPLTKKNKITKTVYIVNFLFEKRCSFVCTCT